MTYLLDADILIFYLRGRPEVQARLLQIAPEDLMTSIICIVELEYGAAKSRFTAKHTAEISELRRELRVLTLMDAEVHYFATLKADLERQGQRLADADLWIATTALSHNLTLVTHNQRHFSREPGLRLEDWVQP